MPHFRYEPLKPKVGELITFYPSVTGTTFTWNFGDGTIVIGSVVTHVYERPGVYFVTAKGSIGELDPLTVIVSSVTSEGTITINIKYVL